MDNPVKNLPKRKDIVMIKKGSLLLLVLLASLPGCGGRKKGDYGRKGRNVSQQTEDFNSVNLALADGLEVDESIQRYFDDMDEFVKFAGQEDFDLVQAEGDALKQDEFAWQDAGDQTKQLETVYFGFNKEKVDKSERAKVANNITKAKKLLADAGKAAEVKLVVEGHACASAGSDAYNMGLSEKRAKEVSDQLVAAGVARSNIKTVGRGNEILVVKDGGREEQWPNRRVEMHVIHS